MTVLNWNIEAIKNAGIFGLTSGVYTILWSNYLVIIDQSEPKHCLQPIVLSIVVPWKLSVKNMLFHICMMLCDLFMYFSQKYSDDKELLNVLL